MKRFQKVFLTKAVILAFTGFGLIHSVSFAQQPGVINPKVLTNDNPDLTSLPALITSLVKPGMTDKEKTIIIYKFVTQRGYEAVYPTDGSKSSWRTSGQDPVKFLNMYSWGECGTYQVLFGELLTAAGVRCRRIELKGHWVIDALYDDSWHYFDPRWQMYFFKRDGKTIASCQDLVDDPTLVTNPVHRDVLGYSPDDESLRRWAEHFEYAKNLDSRTGGIYQPAGQYHTMNMTLARGDEYILSTEKEGDNGFWYYPDDVTERYLKSAANRNHHTVELPGTGPHPISDSRVSGHWKFPGFSNSTLTYTPDFKSGSYVDRVVEQKNMVCSDVEPYLHPKNARQDAYVIFTIQSPYVMVHNLMDVGIVNSNKGNQYNVSISTDDGGTWQNLTGPGARNDISRFVYGKYKYWIKFELVAAGKNTDIGFNSMKLTNICESSPLTVQQLHKGVNEVTVSLDNPQILEKCSLHTEYCWKDKDSKTGKATERTERKQITGSPMKYQIICDTDTEPVTRYIKMIMQ